MKNRIYIHKNETGLINDIEKLQKLGKEYHELLDKVKFKLFENQNISVFPHWIPEENKLFLIDYKEKNQLDQIELNDESVMEFIKCANRKEYANLCRKYKHKKVYYKNDDDDD